MPSFLLKATREPVVVSVVALSHRKGKGVPISGGGFAPADPGDLVVTYPDGSMRVMTPGAFEKLVGVLPDGVDITNGSEQCDGP